jgi:uncharacterized protein
MAARPLLVRLALFARHRYRPIFLVAALLVAVSVGLITRLKFDPDVLNLLPQKDPVVRTFLDTINTFGTIDYLLVAVRVPEGAVLDPYETFVDRLAARLGELPEIGEVEFRLGDTQELLRSFYPKAVLFLDRAGREGLAARLSDEGIRDRVQEMRRLLGTPQGMAMRELMTLDPFGLTELVLGRLQSSRGSLNVDWTSGYYLSRDHRMLLILAKPKGPPQDIDFTTRLVASVEKAVGAVRGEWPQIVGDPSADEALGVTAPLPPEVVQGGGYLTALDDARFIRRDAIVNILTSLAGVLALFLFAFRRLGPLVFAVVPLACGLTWTFGFSAITLRTLSSATSATAALLIGLGIDFVIVSYGRYVEERQRGTDLEGALAAMSGSSGRAVVVGAVTTAATFFAFVGTDFTGMMQMGFLTGTGILFCMVAVLFLLPAMLAWREDHHRRRQREPSLYLHSFGTRRLMGVCMGHPRVALGVGLVLTVGAGVLASRLEFQQGMETMRPAENRGIQVTREVGERFGSGFDYMMMVVRGADPGVVIATADRVVPDVQRLVDDGVLYGYSAISSLIPPPEQQTEVLDWLGREQRNGLRMERIRDSFRRELAAEGLRYEPFAEGVELLAKAISPSAPIGQADFQGSAQSRALLARYLQQTPRGWESVIYLYPPENRWRAEPPPEAAGLAAELGPDVILTGTNVINQRVRTIVRGDAWFAGILGLVLVAALLYLDFHRLRHTVLSLVPLAVGILWMLGAMFLLGMKVNFMNIFVTTMIIGIGVDYGLHVLHRYRESRGGDDAEQRRALVETGNAIVLAALSTIVGFGSLAFSHYPGLRSVGYVAVLGAATTSLVAITLLPAFLAWLRTSRQARAARRL